MADLEDTMADKHWKCRLGGFHAALAGKSFMCQFCLVHEALANKRYICNYCYMIFDLNSDLQKHIRIHTGERLTEPGLVTASIPTMSGAMNPVLDSVRKVCCDVRSQNNIPQSPTISNPRQVSGELGTQNNIPQSPTTRRRWKQLGIYNPPGITIANNNC